MIKNSINLILQGKGGVGKSFASQLLSQYFMDHKKVATSVADTDPVNASTFRVKRLNAIQVNIMEGETILQNRFDDLFELMITVDQTFVVDNGASTFLPMIKYMADNEVLPLLDTTNKPIYLHSVIVGGQPLIDTIEGFKTLCSKVRESGAKNIKVIAWVNDGLGDVIYKDRHFLESPILKADADVLGGVVWMKNYHSDAFTSDIKQVTENNLTLVEALNSSEFKLMQKQRLKKVYGEIYEQLDVIYDLKPEVKKSGGKNE